MFRGPTLLNLDTKGRLVMPTRYRDALLEQCGGQLMVTIDINDRCLQLYPMPKWVEIEQHLNSLPAFNKAARRAQRLLVGHATDLEMDNAGRISIPPVLRTYAALDKKVMLIGQGHRFEIWSEDNWNQKLDEMLAEDDEGDEGLPEQMKHLVL
ncbi:MAG: division/cell wall cluster transcriptional repressor MraZ [Gammaproteobacteria bacterium]